MQELVEEEQALELVEQDQHKQENRKPRQQKKARRKKQNSILLTAQARVVQPRKHHSLRHCENVGKVIR